jgi:hypothetical protein
VNLDPENDRYGLESAMKQQQMTHNGMGDQPYSLPPQGVRGDFISLIS